MVMKLGVLFSGGKDSTLALLMAKKMGYEIACLISIKSENKDSFMFHTPSISAVEKQAEVMGIPIVIQKTKGDKEEELKDLEEAIKKAIKKYKIQGIVTGAVESVYQSSRIQKVCDKLNIECFNPLWQKDQVDLLNELIENKFEVIVVGVAVEGLSKDWLGRKIDKKMINELKELNKRYGINN
ncbi:MAG: diphthine--ammonia ligase [Nanoarchaeota archaeon]